MRRLILVLGILLALTLGSSSHAQMPPLIPTQIENFLDALPELQTLGGRVDPQKFSDISKADPATPFAPLITFIAQSGTMDEATAIAQNYGFANLADWTEIGNRTIRAYATDQASAGLGDSADQVNAAAAQIRTDPDLTPEQQDIMLRQLEAATGTILRFESPPGDLTAIAPYRTRIRRLLLQK